MLTVRTIRNDTLSRTPTGLPLRGARGAGKRAHSRRSVKAVATSAEHANPIAAKRAMAPPEGADRITLLVRYA